MGAGREGWKEEARRVREINRGSEMEGEWRERRAACQKLCACVQPEDSGHLGGRQEGGSTRGDSCGLGFFLPFCPELGP